MGLGAESSRRKTKERAEGSRGSFDILKMTTPKRSLALLYTTFPKASEEFLRREALELLKRSDVEVAFFSILGGGEVFEGVKVTRLKVWDALTGDLLRVIVSVSDAPARVLATHPIDVNIVVSIGQVPQHIIVCGMPRSCRALEIEYVPVHF